MFSVVVYVLLTAVVAAALFALATAVFGRTEYLPAVTPGTTLTELPTGEISGDDIRHLRFGMRFRGYSMAEVDWALDEAAKEIDALRAQLGRSAEGDATPAAATPSRPGDGPVIMGTTEG